MNIITKLGDLLALLRALPSGLWRIECKIKGVSIASDVLLIGRPLVSVCRGSSLKICEGVRIHSSLRSNPLGCFQPSVLRTMSPDAKLELGPGVGLSGSTVIAGKSILVGEGTIIGSGAMIIDNDFHKAEGEWGWTNEYAASAQPIVIGKGVFIGARAIILKGVTIGDRARIGAGAVVTRNVGPGMVAAGNPASIKVAEVAG